MFFNQIVHLLFCHLKLTCTGLWALIMRNDSSWPPEHFSFLSQVYETLTLTQMRLCLLQKHSIIWYVWELKLRTHSGFWPLSIMDHLWYCSFPCSFHSSNCFKDGQWTLWWCLHIWKNCFHIYHLIIFPFLYSRSHDSHFTNECMNALAFSTRQALGASTDGARVIGVHSLLLIQKYSLFVTACSSQYQTLWGRCRYTEHIRTRLLCSRNNLKAVISSYL